MSEEKDVQHARMPMGDTFRRSPFEGLYLHGGKVTECVMKLDEALLAYCKGDMEEFDRLAHDVILLEHEADLIKSNLRGHLPRFIFMPVQKPHFLTLLKEQDKILDYAEDVALWLGFRRTKIPDQLRKDFMEHNKIVVRTVEAYVKALENLKDLLETGFSKKEREETKDFIKDIHELEFQADLKERELTRKIFAMEGELDPISVYHLLRGVDLIAQVANHAENAGDWMRAMLAK